MAARTKSFKATVASVRGGGAVIPVPFDPDELWGKKAKHHVRGSVEGKGLRGVVQRTADGYAIKLGPAWARDCGIAPGAKVAVSIEPEGPQRDALAPDIQEALDANRDAGTFFDALAQFYRKAYLRWIDATKRSPEMRAERIAEMVEHLKAGRKGRPGA